MNENVNRLDRLYNLLPSIYRQRDARSGWQLRTLLRVISEQVNVVEDDIAQLYANWFIETCQDWVVPYIGDLLGFQQVHEAGEPGDVTTVEGQQRNKILISRSDVANTISYRRRRGTLSVLEQLAHDVAGWPAHAVEFYKQLGVTQNANYGHVERGRTIDIRDNKRLYYLGSPFDTEAYTVDVRRPLSHRATGRYNIPNVGLFVWRLKLYSITKAPAFCYEEVGDNCYTFSVLGNDTQLYTIPVVGGPVDELAFPNPIPLRAFERRKTDYYGENKSLYIWTIEPSASQSGGAAQHASTGVHAGQHSHLHHNHQVHDTQQSKQSQEGQDGSGASTTAQPPQLQPVLPDRIIPADLTDWLYRPRPGFVAVDPTLGRIVFPPGHVPDAVYVSYHYAFSADIGGGEYHRPLLQPAQSQLLQIKKGVTQSAGEAQPAIFPSITAALAGWQQWKDQNAQQATPLPQRVVIEILDNEVYTEQIALELEEYEYLYIRAADRQRPVIRLLDWNENRSDAFRVTGEFGSRFALDGLLVEGRGVETEGTINQVAIRHSTLVPGWSIDEECTPDRPEEASLSLYHVGKSVNIEHSIVGSLLVSHDEVREEPLTIAVSDSIVDATASDLIAIGGPEEEIAPAVLNVQRSTVFGTLQVHALEAENGVFTGLITVARRQQGCMRFCAYMPGSRTPRRYHCQPDLVDQAIDTRLKTFPKEEREATKRRERDRVRPIFNSTRYGAATYAQLAFSCAIEITQGADDESEMGVFHDLFQPQREANLRARLNDFTPSGMETGIIYIS